MINITLNMTIGTIGIFASPTSGFGHALTVWGYKAKMNYNILDGTYTKEYEGIYVADSDDSGSDPSIESLKYLPVEYDASSDTYRIKNPNGPYDNYEIRWITAFHPYNPDSYSFLTPNFDIAYLPVNDLTINKSLSFALPPPPEVPEEYKGINFTDLDYDIQPLNPVPEPTSFLLLSLGITGLAFFRRKRPGKD